jgi:polyphosphate glucokinase
MYTPVALAKEKALKETSVVGTWGDGEVSKSTGIDNPRPLAFSSPDRSGSDSLPHYTSHMENRPAVVTATVLAIDIGATSIKFGLVDPEGRLVDTVARVATPYPCSPPRLVELVAGYVSESGCERVGVGFPGAMVDGMVVEPGNLSRPHGFTSPIDPTLHEEWLATDLQRALRQATGVDVRVVNDATLAALGCCVGEGTELVFTLGTGFGIALVIDGELVPIRDVGAEEFVEGESYDRLLGEHARSQGTQRWSELLTLAVSNFVKEFSPTLVHLGGGNSRRVDLSGFAALGVPVVVNGNDVTLSGAVKLFSR